MQLRFPLRFGLLFLGIASQSIAGYTVQEGKFVENEHVATGSLQEHYGKTIEAFEQQKWEETIRQAQIVLINFDLTPFAQEVLFYQGVAYFHLKDFELSDRCLSRYLKEQATPKFFLKALEWKLEIANRYKMGARKHVMGWKNMPMWVPAEEDAIALYDEIIRSLPHHELAAIALFAKADLFEQLQDYVKSVETYQTLIRRFHQHPLAAKAYLRIQQVYLTQAGNEFPDPDFLDLAEINLFKFQRDFPGEGITTEAFAVFQKMTELYAKNLFDTARFYERTKKFGAAKIYFSKILFKFPHTEYAAKARKHLEALHVDVEAMVASRNPSPMSSEKDTEVAHTQKDISHEETATAR